MRVIPGWKCLGTLVPTSRTRPDRSKPMTVGYEGMKRPVSRIVVSAGFRAMDLTAMRRSLGPGVGVRRVVRVRGVDLEGRIAAWWVGILFLYSCSSV